jgi:hypothetical protein
MIKCPFPLSVKIRINLLELTNLRMYIGYQKVSAAMKEEVLKNIVKRSVIRRNNNLL